MFCACRLPACLPVLSLSSHTRTWISLVTLRPCHRACCRVRACMHPYIHPSMQVLEPHYDRDEFKEVVKSLHVAGVPAEEQHQMWVVLAAILKLGNVQFAQVRDAPSLARARRNIFSFLFLFLF